MSAVFSTLNLRALWVATLATLLLILGVFVGSHMLERSTGGRQRTGAEHLRYSHGHGLHRQRGRAGLHRYPQRSEIGSHPPVAVKLSPFFTNMANMARRLDEVGADALVLFNRSYQPDIDLGKLDVELTPMLSVPREMRLPLRWIGILCGRICANLAASGGIHRGSDVVKMLLAGADVTMLCSVLLRHGTEDIRVLERELREGLEKNRHESIAEFKGLVSHKNCSNPSAFERAHYARAR
jgi:hypothetical protein